MDVIINDILSTGDRWIIKPKTISEVDAVIDGKKYIVPLIPIKDDRNINTYLVSAIVHMNLEMDKMKQEIAELKSNKVLVPEND